MKPLGLLDWVGVIAALVAASLVALFPIQSFVTMFQDLGGPLPAVTRLVLQPWSRIALLLPTVAASAMVAGARARRTAWRPWLVASIVMGFLAFGFCVVAMYLPIFQLADKIKP